MYISAYIRCSLHTFFVVVVVAVGLVVIDFLVCGGALQASQLTIATNVYIYYVRFFYYPAQFRCGCMHNLCYILCTALVDIYTQFVLNCLEYSR